MTEQLISFETAELAKEKNFNLFKDIELIYGELPTQSLLQKWLREKHKIDILVGMFLDSYIVHISYEHKLILKYEGDTIQKFNKYEYALEAGLKEGLKLIK